MTITAFTLAHSVTLALSSLGKGVICRQHQLKRLFALSVIFLARGYLALIKGESNIYFPDIPGQ